MTDDEFLSLCQFQTNAILLKAAKSGEPLIDVIIATPKPRTQWPPKYDSRLSARNGFHYASECDLEQLTWYQRRNMGTQPEQYAAKAAKVVHELSFWIAWRREHPDAIWRGQRGGKDGTIVTAAPPTSKPPLHEWEQRGGAERQREERKPLPDIDGGDASDDDIPF